MELKVFKIYGYCAVNELSIRDAVKYYVVNSDLNSIVHVVQAVLAWK